MRAARLLVLTVVASAMLAALAAAAAPPALDWSKLDAESLQKLAEYIRVDTTDPPGNEIRGAQWFARIFKAEGIPYEIAESAPGRGNIVARLKAGVPDAEKQPALVLLSHMDVVPVNREYWHADPYGAEIRDGYLWGRGTLDMKGQGIANLMAFLLLHREHVPLVRDVIFLGTADEEAGGNYGAGWVAKQSPQWIEGAGFLLTEGANSLGDAQSNPIYFGLAAMEKAPAWLRLTATGRAGHGSVPIPESATNHLVAALERLRTYQPPLDAAPAIARALATLAPYEPEPWRTRLADIAAFIRQPDAREELAKRPHLLALVTNTISITSLAGSNKINIIPPVATAELDCRILPGWTIDRWVAEVRRIIADDSIRVDVVLNFPPASSPVDTPLTRSVREAARRLYPRAGVVESLITGFTDSHFFRERGIASYGFEPFAVTREDGERVHGNDERIPVKAFTDGVRLMWEVVYDFSRAQGRSRGE